MPDLKSINPANSDVVGVYPQLTAKEINEIIIDVENEFNSWRSYSNAKK